METDDKTQTSLKAMNSLREPLLRSIIQALHLPQGSHGLDAGCAYGFQALLLAQAVGSRGHVTGLDLSTGLLACARELAEQAGFSRHITFKQGDIRRLPFEDNTFDWVWSSDCAGYAPLDAEPLIKELVRVIKPEGTLNLCAWSSETLLPGYPVLEARLKATKAGIAPFSAGKPPRQHFLRALGWLKAAGLVECQARVFSSSVYAPLSEDSCLAMTDLFQMRWSGCEHELSRADYDEYRRICLPDSPDFILNQPDYYAFFTYSLFRGSVVK